VVVTRPVAMSYTWPETLTFGESRGEVSRRSTSASDGGLRVGDRGCLQRCLGEAGRHGGMMPGQGPLRGVPDATRHRLEERMRTFIADSLA
jgi:hypothetical protein